MTSRANTATHAGEYAHEYTSFAADIDLLSDTNGPANGNCARGFVVTDPGSGTLVVKLRGSAATDKTFANCASIVGVPIPLQFQGIDAVTDIGAIIVIW